VKDEKFEGRNAYFSRRSIESVVTHVPDIPFAVLKAAGFKSYFPYQEEAIRTILSNPDSNLPTARLYMSLGKIYRCREEKKE